MHLRRSLRGEGGFSMVVVMGVSMIGALLATAALSLTPATSPSCAARSRTSRPMRRPRRGCTTTCSTSSRTISTGRSARERLLGNQPSFLGTWQTATRALAMPPSNASLSTLTQAAYKFTGTTTLRFTTANIAVTNNGATTNMAYPSNGLIYVKSGACGTNTSPPLQDYNEPSGCANVYISGTYSQSLTIASEKDIIIKPPASSSNGDVRRSGDVLLGLIANNFVRVYHRVTRSDWTDADSCTNVNTASAPLMGDVSIDAAILSLTHSFIVDNHACGAQLGTLTIVGAIAQRFRGFVGTFGSASTGFSKDYTYDDRLRYREPPSFLEPVATAWRIVRQNEQVPAR